MDIIETTLTDLHEAADRLMKDRPDLGVHIVEIGEYGLQAVSVEVTRQPRTRCERCGQHLETDHPGPVVWVDERYGGPQGGWSHQHGCGEWHSPIAARVELVPDEQDWETVLADLAREVDAEVREERDEMDAATRARLARQLRDALGWLAEGADPDDVTTGGDTEPGVCRDDAGRWIAWDMDADGTDPIIVTEDDLR